MPKTSGVTGYLLAGGSDLIHAIVLMDGKIVTYAGRQLIEDVDVQAAKWLTQRAATALLAQVGVATDLATIALIGPNGGLTKFAHALNADGGRNSQVLDTVTFVSKMDAKHAPEILDALAKEYAASTAIAA